MPVAPTAADAFDLWLRRSLRDLYDHVAAEPLPADLVRLLDEGREGSETTPRLEDR
jgi:hypothetical protein